MEKQTPSEVVEAAKYFLDSVEAEAWFYLANAAYVETSKEVIHKLIEACESLQNGSESSPKPDLPVTKSLTGNRPGKKIMLDGIGICTIEEVLPPINPLGIERIVVIMPDGQKQTFDVNQLNIGSDVIQ